MDASGDQPTGFLPCSSQRPGVVGGKYGSDKLERYLLLVSTGGNRDNCGGTRITQIVTITTVQHGVLAICESTEHAVHVLLHTLRYYRILP